MPATPTGQTLQHHEFRVPDEVRTSDNGQVELLHVWSGHDGWVVVVGWYGATEYPR